MNLVPTKPNGKYYIWTENWDITPTPTKKYSGVFVVKGKEVYIKEVIYSGPATIVLWSDKTKTICKCHDTDLYNKETGLLVCVYKKLYGSTNLKNLLNDWTPEPNMNGVDKITLRDVIRKHK